MSRAEAIRAAQPIRHAPFKAAVLLMVCLAPLVGSVICLARGNALPAVAYSVMSAVALLVYRHDKRRAQAGGQRVPEKLLHALELCGGWPGALVAQQRWRHKTRKLPFQLQLWLIIAVHQAFWCERLLFGGRYLGSWLVL